MQISFQRWSVGLYFSEMLFGNLRFYIYIYRERQIISSKKQLLISVNATDVFKSLKNMDEPSEESLHLENAS